MFNQRAATRLDCFEVGTAFRESGFATINWALSGIGEVVGAVGVVTGAGCVALDTYPAYNNPNVTPDRAASDAYVEFQVGSWELVGGTAIGMIASSAAYGAVAGSFGGPAGIVAGAIVGLAIGIGVLILDRYIEDSGIKQQLKDDRYAANHSYGR